MSKSIEQQAFSTLVEQDIKRIGETWAEFHERHVAALSRAGLLVSERDVLCRKLADAYFAYCKRYGYSCNVGLTNPGPERDAVRAAAEALASYDREHAPKPRYYVEAMLTGDGDTHRVRDRVKMNSVGEPSVRGYGTEDECIAIMNALAEKEAGR